MKSFFQFILGFLQPAEPPARVTLQGQYILEESGAKKRQLVQRTPNPYWNERGWQQQGRDYVGSFQTRYGSWQGRITVSPAGRIEVLIADPPSELKEHPHWHCFRLRGLGWYFIHPTSPVRDVSAGILSTEKTLREAFEL